MDETKTRLEELQAKQAEGTLTEEEKAELETLQAEIPAEEAEEKASEEEATEK